MHVALADFLRDTPEGQEAAGILQRCVHCGFCNATCPTYRLLGDELDGPRGRIYLIKQVLEGREVTVRTQLHLDRCLTCLGCETTCPSGVRYGRLLAIGRELVEQRVRRTVADRLTRGALATVLPRSWLFSPLAEVGRALRPLLPAVLADKLPVTTARDRQWPARRPHSRHMLLLGGCVQPALSPNINAAMARLLDCLGIAAVEIARAGCCGALNHHLGEGEAALQHMRRNIDAWWPAIEAGAEAIVVTASGCGVHVKDYAHLLRNDSAYAEKALRVSALCKDPAQVLEKESSILLPRLTERNKKRGKLALHLPCSLQHGLRIHGVIERFLDAAGFERVPVGEAHLCCGSAGTYSVLQPELATRLRDRKLDQLTKAVPARIATANIGCLTHLQAGSAVPVSHWVEVIDEVLELRS